MHTFIQPFAAYTLCASDCQKKHLKKLCGELVKIALKSATYGPGPPRTSSSLIVEPVVWVLSMLTSMLTFKLSQAVRMLSSPDDTTRNHHKCPAVLHRPPDYPSPTDGKRRLTCSCLAPWMWTLQTPATIYSLVQGQCRCKSAKDLHHRQCLQFSDHKAD